MMGVRPIGIILAIAALSATAALAQQKQDTVSALKGHNSDAPVDISADRIEVQDQADRAIFAGNVHATQEDLTLDTQRLTVAYSSGQSYSSGVQIRRLDAAGCETASDQCCRAVADHAPNLPFRQRRSAALDQQRVERRGEITARVDQGTVEIENVELIHHRETIGLMIVCSDGLSATNGTTAHSAAR